jgi:hypothetical protein
MWACLPRSGAAVRDLLVNLLASVLAGTAVWLSQRVRRHRRVARKRSFFGVSPDAPCLLTVAKHAASPHQNSVHRRDVAALVELATIVRDCGGRADLVPDEDAPQGVGRATEFCVGGPSGNPRMAAHLRALLPGVHEVPSDATPPPTAPATDGPGYEAELPVTVGSRTFRREAGRAEYVVLARVRGPAGGRPVFLLNGQTARSNLAAARFLAAEHASLHRRYGASRPFCLVLRLVEPTVYGADFTEVAADLTREAFAPTASPPAVAAG